MSDEIRAALVKLARMVIQENENSGGDHDRHEGETWQRRADCLDDLYAILAPLGIDESSYTRWKIDPMFRRPK